MAIFPGIYFFYPDTVYIASIFVVVCLISHLPSRRRLC